MSDLINHTPEQLNTADAVAEVKGHGITVPDFGPLTPSSPNYGMPVQSPPIVVPGQPLGALTLRRAGERPDNVIIIDV